MAQKKLDLHRRWLSLGLAILFALSLTLVLAMIGGAGRIADWGATEFQLQNVDSVPAEVTARFYDLDGDEAFVFTDTIPPGQTVYYQPEEDTPGLKPDFEGTLLVETEQEVAGAVMHLMTTTIEGMNGNDVFEMVSDEITATMYYAARVERSLDKFDSRILVTNLSPSLARVTVTVYNRSGLPVWDTQADIPIRGNWILDLDQQVDLGEDFTGSAIIESRTGEPIRVEVIRSSKDQWAIYSAQSKGSSLLVAPLIRQHAWGIITPTIDLLNTTLTDTVVIVCSADGSLCESYPLEGRASQRIIPPVETIGPYLIESMAPIIAVVGFEGEWGCSAYAAEAPELASTRLAAPMLYQDYLEWATGLWIYNTGPTTTTVNVTYRGVVTEPVEDKIEKEVGPGSAALFEPLLGVPHYAAWVSADQPLMGVVEGINWQRSDGYFTYWATPYETTLKHRVYMPLILSHGSSGTLK